MEYAEVDGEKLLKSLSAVFRRARIAELQLKPANGLQLIDARVFLLVDLLHGLYRLIAQQIKSHESLQVQPLVQLAR
jgi:hypothetical protein